MNIAQLGSLAIGGLMLGFAITGRTDLLRITLGLSGAATVAVGLGVVKR